MPFSSVDQTLLPALDSRRTPLAERAAQGRASIAHTPHGHFSAPQPVVSRMGFNGQLREPQGWYQLGDGYRVYNPALMAFHCPDELSPFGRGGINAYAYCHGDPVNFTDPSGRFVMELPSLIVHHLFDTPIVNLAHNAALLMGALMLNVLAPPTGAALVASAGTVMGSAVGIAGNVMVFVGQKELGSKVATVGTALSSIGSITRVSLTAQKLKEAGPKPFKGFWEKAGDTWFGFKPKGKPKGKPRGVPATGKAPRRGSAPAVLGKGEESKLPQNAVQELMLRAKTRRTSVFDSAVGEGPDNKMNRRMSMIYMATK